MLSLYNTLARQKQPFQPALPPHVNMYVCGPTVYDDAHLGHARCYIAWDVLARVLAFLGYEVRYARNITDVDDKIINRAAEQGVPFAQWAERYTQRFHEDMAALNVAPPNDEPKATDHINGIIEGCNTLIANGHAYATDRGNVYFRTASKADYGKLSRKPLDDLKSGVRVVGEDDKESPLDFALWKAADASDENTWPSPWGGDGCQQGRPGWHMECSAMNHALFGSKLDIHAGGADLTFPHHENEIAQSEAWSGHQPFSTYWLHNGFVTVDGDKMSKSLANFATVRDLLRHYPANALRHFLLTHHYRMPVDFTPDGLLASTNRVGKIHKTLKRGADALTLAEVVIAQLEPLAHNHSAMASFTEALSDDLNTPRALAELDGALTRLNKTLDTHGDNPALVRDAFMPAFSMWHTLGFAVNAIYDVPQLPAELFDTLNALLRKEGLQQASTAEDAIERVLAARQQAKSDKNWPLADKLRDELTTLGITIKDSKQGAEWSYQPASSLASAAK